MAGKGIELGTEFSNASSMGAEAFYRGAFMSMEVSEGGGGAYWKERGSSYMFDVMKTAAEKGQAWRIDAVAAAARASEIGGLGNNADCAALLLGPASKGDAGTVRALLAAGANPYGPHGREGDSRFYDGLMLKAMNSGNAGTVKALLGFKADGFYYGDIAAYDPAWPEKDSAAHHEHLLELAKQQGCPSDMIKVLQDTIESERQKPSEPGVRQQASRQAVAPRPR
jgi:hypothetical protein